MGGYLNPGSFSVLLTHEDPVREAIRVGTLNAKLEELMEEFSDIGFTIQLLDTEDLF